LCIASIADKTIHLTQHFEEDKISEYKNEINMRVSLASIFENIIQSVIKDVSDLK
jgi:hypothetical protein